MTATRSLSRALVTEALDALSAPQPVPYPHDLAAPAAGASGHRVRPPGHFAPSDFSTRLADELCDRRHLKGSTTFESIVQFASPSRLQGSRNTRRGRAQTRPAGCTYRGCAIFTRCSTFRTARDNGSCGAARIERRSVKSHEPRHGDSSVLLHPDRHVRACGRSPPTSKRCGGKWGDRRCDRPRRARRCHAQNRRTASVLQRSVGRLARSRRSPARVLSTPARRGGRHHST
jgi:hypothetical protein